VNKYQAKIIATDQEALQVISACVSNAEVKISDIKYLKSNKVFLLSIERIKVEGDQKNEKVNSILNFSFIDKVKSKNINQENQEKVLELIGIDYLKNKEVYEINLIFDNNAHIVLSTETIEVRLEDQETIDK
tara:strand:+ start:2002 stop:2397 length:396 start_codon:yes stop_codon:yes gene_type:complete